MTIDRMIYKLLKCSICVLSRVYFKHEWQITVFVVKNKWYWAKAMRIRMKSDAIYRYNYDYHN